MSHQIKTPEIKTKEDMIQFANEMHKISFNWWFDKLGPGSPRRMVIPDVNFDDALKHFSNSDNGNIKVMNRPFDPHPCIEVILETVICSKDMYDNIETCYYFLWIQVEPDAFWDYKEGLDNVRDSKVAPRS